MMGVTMTIPQPGAAEAEAWSGVGRDTRRVTLMDGDGATTC